jgi:hypothetical protein
MLHSIEQALAATWKEALLHRIWFNACQHQAVVACHVVSCSNQLELTDAQQQQQQQQRHQISPCHPHRCGIDACPDEQPLQACVGLRVDGRSDAQLKAAAGHAVQRQLAGTLVVGVGLGG